MPSDYQGVLYVELDAAGGWRARLKSYHNAKRDKSEESDDRHHRPLA
jgi:hypothetical protein